MARVKKFIDDIKESLGVGDVIASVTKLVGIEPCDDCEVRRLKMNEMFRFLKLVKRDMTEDEIELIEYYTVSGAILDRIKFLEIYNGVFGTSVRLCNCPGLFKELLNKLNKQIEKQMIK